MRVKKLQSEFDLEVVFKAFPLHPNTPAEGLTLEELFAGRDVDIASAHERMCKAMADEGLPYSERTMTYNSRLAQELASWAGTRPAAGDIHDALFRAYFVENVNLADVNNLVEIAGSIGLPKDEAMEVLETRCCRDAVDSDWKRAGELGLTGVPSFVMGNQGLVGAASYDQLKSLVSAVIAEGQ